MRNDIDDETFAKIVAVIRRFDASGGRAPETAAREWLEAGFDDPEEVKDWLSARCSEAAWARRLEEAGITPEQAATLTTSGSDGTQDTIGSKLVKGGLSFEEARRIITSEFWN